MCTDEEAQQDEVLAMQSILDGDAFQLHPMPGGVISGQIKVRLDLPNPFYISVQMEVDPPNPEPKEEVAAASTRGIVDGGDVIATLTEARYKVEYLPPITLHFTLPKNYPSHAKPNFTLSATWLHRMTLSILCQKLDELWEENKGMGILFTWSNYLQANTLSDLGIHDFYHIDWVQKPLQISQKRNKSDSEKMRNWDEDEEEEEVHSRVLNDTDDTEPLPLLSPELVQTNKKKDKPVAMVFSSVVPSSSKPPKVKRRRSRSRTRDGNVSLLVDQRAALDTIPRLEGKEVSVLNFLLSYNDDIIQKSFQQSSHACDICFTMKTGHSCVRFRCGHVFCTECVRTCFTTHITEGNVDQVKCLAFNCKIQPSPEIVRKVVGKLLFERYDQILLKRALENMEDITYCPMPKCNTPVIFDPEEKCTSCPKCGHIFCCVCKMVYHGVEPCKFKGDMKEVLKKYRRGTPEEKQVLHKVYGEKQLKILVQNELSDQWIRKASKQCPHCKAPIEKFEGCNKVTCFKCNTYFCWLCLTLLEQGNPYSHFNNPESNCYNKLFQDPEANQGLADYSDSEEGEDKENDWETVSDDDDE